MKLTERQKRFADYYIETGNAAEAARQAGYKQPQVQGSENLVKPNVKVYIQQRLQALEDKRIASAAEVLKYLTAILRGDETEEVVVVEGCGDGRSEASKIDKNISAKDRIKAAELLGKRYGIWVDRQQVEGSAAVQIVDNVPKEK